MPVLESTDRVAPRSIVRHRPIDDASQRSVVTTAAHPMTQRASRMRPQVADDDLISEWKRGDIEEAAPVPPRKATPPARRVAGSMQRQPAVHTRPRFRAHPLLFLGLGMLAMLVLWTVLVAGLHWWSDAMDYLHYGYPRTFQLEAVVGHGDSASNPSHYLAINLHGKIEVIEFPGEDASHARIYLGPQLFGSDADKAAVTLTFVDVNGDRRPDMLIFFQNSWIIFINDQSSFRPPTDQEHAEAARYIASHRQ